MQLLDHVRHVVAVSAQLTGLRQREFLDLYNASFVALLVAVDDQDALRTLLTVFIFFNILALH